MLTSSNVARAHIDTCARQKPWCMTNPENKAFALRLCVRRLKSIVALLFGSLKTWCRRDFVMHTQILDVDGTNAGKAASVPCTYALRSAVDVLTKKHLLQAPHGFKLQ